MTIANSFQQPLKDSGARTEFATGSVRDRKIGKGRFDLLPFFAIQELARHFEKGAVKYGDRNWEKGQPLSSYLDSAIRHLTQAAAGKTDEPHFISALWNVACLIETAHWIDQGKLPAELNDIKADNTAAAQMAEVLRTEVHVNTTPGQAVPDQRYYFHDVVEPILKTLADLREETDQSPFDTLSRLLNLVRNDRLQGSVEADAQAAAAYAAKRQEIEDRVASRFSETAQFAGQCGLDGCGCNAGGAATALSDGYYVLSQAPEFWVLVSGNRIVDSAPGYAGPTEDLSRLALALAEGRVKYIGTQSSLLGEEDVTTLVDGYYVVDGIEGWVRVINGLVAETSDGLLKDTDGGAARTAYLKLGLTVGSIQGRVRYFGIYRPLANGVYANPLNSNEWVRVENGLVTEAAEGFSGKIGTSDSLDVLAEDYAAGNATLVVQPITNGSNDSATTTSSIAGPKQTLADGYYGPNFAPDQWVRVENGICVEDWDGETYPEDEGRRRAGNVAQWIESGDAKFLGATLHDAAAIKETGPALADGFYFPSDSPEDYIQIENGVAVWANSHPVTGSPEAVAERTGIITPYVRELLSTGFLVYSAESPVAGQYAGSTTAVMEEEVEIGLPVVTAAGFKRVYELNEPWVVFTFDGSTMTQPDHVHLDGSKCQAGQYAVNEEEYQAVLSSGRFRELPAAVTALLYQKSGTIGNPGLAAVEFEGATGFFVYKDGTRRSTGPHTLESFKYDPQWVQVAI